MSLRVSIVSICLAMLGCSNAPSEPSASPAEDAEDPIVTTPTAAPRAEPEPERAPELAADPEPDAPPEPDAAPEPEAPAPKVAGKRPIAGSIAITAAEASARGLPPWSVSFDQPEHYFDASRDQAPPVFVSMSTPPGGPGYISLSAVEGVHPDAKSLDAYAAAQKTDDEIRPATRKTLGGIDRWVGHLVSAGGMHGPEVTALVLVPGIVDGTGIIVTVRTSSAGGELDPVLEQVDALFTSLDVRFQADVLLARGRKAIRGTIEYGSDGHVKVVSAIGGPAAEKALADAIAEVDAMESLAHDAPPPRGSPRHTSAARLYRRTDAYFAEGLRLTLAEHDIELVAPAP